MVNSLIDHTTMVLAYHNCMVCHTIWHGMAYGMTHQLDITDIQLMGQWWLQTSPRRH